MWNPKLFNVCMCPIYKGPIANTYQDDGEWNGVQRNGGVQRKEVLVLHLNQSDGEWKCPMYGGDLSMEVLVLYLSMHGEWKSVHCTEVSNEQRFLFLYLWR